MSSRVSCGGNQKKQRTKSQGPDFVREHTTTCNYLVGSPHKGIDIDMSIERIGSESREASSGDPLSHEAAESPSSPQHPSGVPVVTDFSPPSKYAVKICSEIAKGELLNLVFQLSKFTRRDMRYFAGCFRNNQTIQSIVLPVHLFELDDVLENILNFLEFNRNINRVAFSSSPDCYTRCDVFRCLTRAISKNRSVHTLELSQFLRVRGKLEGRDLHLRESGLKSIKVIDRDTKVTKAVFQALGNNIQSVELVALPSRIGLYLGGAYGTPLQPETSEAMACFVKRSTGITKLSIKGCLDESFASLTSALMTNQTVQEIVLLSPRTLSPVQVALLKSTIERSQSLTSITLDGRALIRESLGLLSETIAARHAIKQFWVSIDGLRVSPEILTTLLPEHGHLTSVSFGSMDFSQVPAKVLAMIGHDSLTSLSFDRTPLDSEQLQAVLHSATHGALTSLRSLKLHTSQAVTRGTLHCLATCLDLNRNLHNLSVDCREHLSVAYLLCFDKKRCCTLDSRLRDVSRGQLDVLTEWLSENTQITFSKLNVHYAKRQTLEYLSRNFLCRFRDLNQFSITWPTDVSVETKHVFLSAIQKNQTLLYISVGTRDNETLRCVHFVQARNRVKALLRDRSVGAIALWPRVLRRFGDEGNRSALFVAAREGIGNFWLPDA